VRSPTGKGFDKRLWKIAQKNEMKNNISEIINRIIPRPMYEIGANSTSRGI
jgi:hypothetical protein